MMPPRGRGDEESLAIAARTYKRRRSPSSSLRPAPALHRPIYSGMGRIGRAGQVRTVPYTTATEAHAALAQQRRLKERRGYIRK